MTHDKAHSGDCAMPDHLKGVHHDISMVPRGGLALRREDLNLVRQWFDAMQDAAPESLERADYRLARIVYWALEMRVPNSINDNC